MGYFKDLIIRYENDEPLTPSERNYLKERMRNHKWEEQKMSQKKLETL